MNAKDKAHQIAVDYSRRTYLLVVTTEWIVTEFADGIARSKNRHLVQHLVADLEGDANNILVPCTDELFHRGLALYDARPDKEWSLTDCTSFIVMQERGIVEALTGDHHFEQAGFRLLL